VYFSVHLLGGNRFVSFLLSQSLSSESRNEAKREPEEFLLKTPSLKCCESKNETKFLPLYLTALANP
jgi:hypothetical protein